MENQNPNFNNPNYNNPNQGNNFNNPNQQNYGNNFNRQPNLPNATGVLVLGIVSCVAWICYGLPGIICAIISLVLSKKANDLYLQNPSQYSSSSYGLVKSGRICATIGLIIGILSFIGYAIAIVVSIMNESHRYDGY